MEFESIHKPLNLDGFNDEVGKAAYLSPTLEKATLAECFAHSHSVGSRASGKEIKAGLKKVIAHASATKKGHASDMRKLERESKAAPEDKMPTYRTRGLEAFMDHVPKVYSEKQISACIKEKREKNPNYSYSDCPMAKHNMAANAFVDCYVEKLYAKAMEQSIDDSQTYYLTVKQATKVGIGS